MNHDIEWAYTVLILLGAAAPASAVVAAGTPAIVSVWKKIGKLWCNCKVLKIAQIIFTEKSYLIRQILLLHGHMVCLQGDVIDVEADWVI